MGDSSSSSSSVAAIRNYCCGVVVVMVMMMMGVPALFGGYVLHFLSTCLWTLLPTRTTDSRFRSKKKPESGQKNSAYEQALRIVMYEVEYRMGSFAARGRHCRAGWTHPVKLGYDRH